MEVAISAAVESFETLPLSGDSGQLVSPCNGRHSDVATFVHFGSSGAWDGWFSEIGVGPILYERLSTGTNWTIVQTADSSAEFGYDYSAKGVLPPLVVVAIPSV